MPQCRLFFHFAHGCVVRFLAGSQIPVTGVHAPLSERLTRSTSGTAHGESSVESRSTTAVTAGIHIRSVPIFFRVSTMNSGMGMCAHLSVRKIRASSPSKSTSRVPAREGG